VVGERDVPRIPMPGQPVRGSRSGAPIMALFDLLGRRWAMGVLWTLAEAGPCSFGTLEALCETISPGVLSTRLKELQSARLIENSPDGYRVTRRGRELYGMLEPMGRWSKAWARELLASGRGSGAARPRSPQRGKRHR
jgi:DNA-binding HxlR family transcriptional regulator